MNDHSSVNPSSHHVGLRLADWTRRAVQVDGLDDPRRITHRNRPVRNILCDHRSCPDCACVTNFDPREDNDGSSEPAVIANVDGLGPFRTRDAVAREFSER
jgi:hypothetical protein